MHSTLRAQNQGPFEEAEAARVLYECLTTIAACHRQNLFHGDVKPANFMLCEQLPSGNLSEAMAG
jgi:serine/threonine protein kinase